MTNVEYPLEACGYIVLYTSLPSEKCISMCIHRKQKFALTTTTKFLLCLAAALMNMKSKHDPLSQYHQQDKLLWLLTQDVGKYGISCPDY